MSAHRIRPARAGDLDALYDICLRTADAGGDASHLHEDPRLPGHVWAAPYLLHEPEHCFVVVDEDDAARGYVLGALDSRSFEARLEQEWWPALRAEHPLDDDRGTEADRAAVRLLHHPPLAHDAVVDRYPSHLHVDLLADVQGRGFGRRLIETLLGSLSDAGSPGVHLGVARRNERAVGFYPAVGFTELFGDDRGVLFGRRLD